MCSVVGVGFVSGAEIYEVFVRFGKFWPLGVAVFFLLMFLISFKIILNYCNSKNISKMYFENNNYVKNTFLSKFKIKSFLLFFNILLVSGAMFSGLRTLLKQLCNNNYVLIFVLCVLVIFLVLFFGVSGLQKMDYFVLVFMILLAMFFACQTFGENQYQILSLDNNFKAGLFSVFFAVLYVFMNILQIEPILSEFNISFSKRKALLLSFFFSFVLTLLLIVFVLFFNANAKIAESSMPFLSYFKSKGGALFYVFSVGLILALVSSLLAALIGLKRRFISKTSNLVATLLSIFLGLVVSVFDFSFFVSVVYPLVGFVNFVIFVFL